MHAELPFSTRHWHGEFIGTCETHSNPHLDEAPVGCKTSLDDAPEHRNINVSSAKRNDNLLTHQPRVIVKRSPRKQCGEASSATPLYDSLARERNLSTLVELS